MSSCGTAPPREIVARLHAKIAAKSSECTALVAAFQHIPEGAKLGGARHQAWCDTWYQAWRSAAGGAP